jgi:hypothetical protein
MTSSNRVAVLPDAMGSRVSRLAFKAMERSLERLAMKTEIFYGLRKYGGKYVWIR